MATHRVQGMDGGGAAPDWPALTTGEIAILLERFDALAGPLTIAWLSPRPFSAAARVVTSAGEVFIKRQHIATCGVAGLQREHDFRRYLGAAGIPTPRLFRADDGNSVQRLGDWVYEVSELAQGQDSYRDTPSWVPPASTAQAVSAGRMLARLHQAAVGFQSTSRDDCLLAAGSELLCGPDLEAGLLRCQQHRPGLAAYLAKRHWRREIQPLAARLAELYPRLMALPALWTHNDWHVSNLFWSHAGPDASVTSVVDFGLAAQTFALYDLATAIERNAIAWLEMGRDKSIAKPAIALALLEGYQQLLPLNRGERELLAAILPLVHLDFAAAEVDYFGAITRSMANADLAWEGFFLGHVDWFDSAEGRALLAAIRSA